MYEKVKVLVIGGGGGREHVLAGAYGDSPNVGEVHVIPGNDLSSFGIDKPVFTYQGLKTTNPEILEICVRQQFGLVDVAQDNAVAVGMADLIRGLGIPVVGPSRLASRIEWDKPHARLLLEGLLTDGVSVNQPRFRIFQDQESGIKYIENRAEQERFVKAAGLTEGKGALPARTAAEAIRRIREMDRFGEAGKTYLIEEWLRGDDGSEGEEFSAFALCSEGDFKILGYAQDHKRAFDKDEGENTGGMGCSTPPLVLTEEIKEEVNDILETTLINLTSMRTPYEGVLYLGGMLVKRQGELRSYVLEFNARWGDPEAEVIVPGIKNDFFELGLAAAERRIADLNIETDGLARVSVALASKGYPGNYDQAKWKEISGINEASKVDGVRLFGAGVRRLDGKDFAIGGRLLHVVGEGENVIEAREKAYQAVEMIRVEGNNGYYRTDIGMRDVRRLQS